MSDDAKKPGTDEAAPDPDAQSEEVGAFQDRLDEEADADGLEAEAGTAEENGISQG